MNTDPTQKDHSEAEFRRGFESGYMCQQGIIDRLTNEVSSLKSCNEALANEHDQQDKLINELCVKLEHSKQVIEAAAKSVKLAFLEMNQPDNMRNDLYVIGRLNDALGQLSPPNPVEPV